MFWGLDFTQNFLPLVHWFCKIILQEGLRTNELRKSISYATTLVADPHINYNNGINKIMLAILHFPVQQILLQTDERLSHGLTNIYVVPVELTM